MQLDPSNTHCSVTIVSILRLRSLVTFANSTNPTWDQWEIAYWSTIEVNIGMICTCLPSLRLIFVRLFPKVLETSVSPSRSGPSVHDTRGQSILRSRPSSNGHGGHYLSDINLVKGDDWQVQGECSLACSRILALRLFLTPTWNRRPSSLRL